MLLISKLPTMFGYARRVCEKLQKAKTVQGVAYTNRIVYDIIHQGHNDWRVEKALVELNEDYFEQPISAIFPGYTPPIQYRTRQPAEAS